MAERYIASLTNRPKLKRKLRVVAACGNGTAGAIAPKVLEAIGCEVVPLDCELDHSFPNYNPNTEDMKMLHAMRDAVINSGADVAFGQPDAVQCMACPRLRWVEVTTAGYTRYDTPEFLEGMKARFRDNFYYILYFQQPGVAETEFDADPRAILSRL